LTVEIRLRSKILDDLLAVSKRIGEALKTPSSDPKFNEQWGDYTAYFTIREVNENG